MDKTLVTWIPLAVMVVTLVMKYISDQTGAKKIELDDCRKRIEKLEEAEERCKERVDALRHENYELALKLVGMVPTTFRDVASATVKSGD